MKSPWGRVLEVPASDAKLAERVRLPAQMVPDLSSLHPDIGSDLLQQAFKSFYEPSTEDLRLIRKIANSAIAYASRAYPSVEHFRRTAQCRFEIGQESSTRMVTGHSGAGKSTLMAAVRRLLSTDQVLDAGSDLAPFPMVLTAHVKMYPKITIAELLVAVAERIEVELDAKRTSGSALRFLQQRMYQRSVLLVLADEMQFAARSASASALIAQLIATLSGFGAPVFFAANFSLGHKLKTRPPEDVARFCSEPLIMLPLLPEDDGFVTFLEGARTILGGALSLDLNEHGEQFHAMTFGLRRQMARLLIGGYRIACAQRRTGKEELLVTIEHLRLAYKSTDFAEDRAIVENCQQAELGSRANLAYVCPFEMTPSETSRMRKLSESVQRAALNAAVSRDMMTTAEWAVARVQAAAKRRADPTPTAKKSAAPSQPLTAENLLKHLVVRPPSSRG